METISSSWKSLKTGVATTTGWHRTTTSRSASLSNNTSPLHTGPCEGDTNVQDDPSQCLVVGPHEQTLQEAKAEVETWKKRAQEADERTRLAEARLAEANQRHDAEWATFERARREEKQVSGAEDRINHLQAALSQSRQELQGTVALLDRRSAELRDAQAYLSRPDDVADGEVLALVERINSIIFQTAANIADTFRPRYGEQQDPRVVQEPAERVRNLFGDDLLHALCSVDHSDEALAVQIALQAVMVFYTRWRSDTWDFNVAGHQHVLQDVYRFIRRAGTYFTAFGRDSDTDENPEQQSVAGRWRALSRTYVKMLVKNDADPERNDVGVLALHIADILLVRGVAAGPQDLRTEVGSSYADALREIVHLSLEFQRITGEGIISRDLLMLAPRSGKPFDPSRMINECADPKNARHGDDTYPVLCTTQLGLVREEKKATEGGGKEATTAVVLLKPKIVLTSFLDELQSDASS